MVGPKPFLTEWHLDWRVVVSSPVSKYLPIDSLSCSIEDTVDPFFFFLIRFKEMECQNCPLKYGKFGFSIFHLNIPLLPVNFLFTYHRQALLLRYVYTAPLHNVLDSWLIDSYAPQRVGKWFSLMVYCFVSCMSGGLQEHITTLWCLQTRSIYTR